MYYNKRLHPRQHVEHRDGCLLHELEEQQHQQRIARHSSLSSLDHHLPQTPRRRRLTSTGSTCSGSTANLSSSYTPSVTSPIRRDYISPISLLAMQHQSLHSYRSPLSLVGDSLLSRNMRSPSVPESDSSTTSILSTHASDLRKHSDSHSLKNVSFSGDFVDGRSHPSTKADTASRRYDSPAEIIASLFPESAPNTRRNSTTAAASRKVTPSSKSGRPSSATIVNPPWLGGGGGGSVARRSSTQSTPSRSATVNRRSVYRPDSLQSLDRAFDEIKYEL